MAGKQNDVAYASALELLQAGNARYVADKGDHPNCSASRRAETGGGQWPFAIILSCADSRVSPELIFDQGIGDLFIARVAGNVATKELIGSIQYAVQFIRTELVVVLGHEACGAVNAAIAPPDNAPEELGALVSDIQGVIGSENDLQKAVEMNAKAQAAALSERLTGPNLGHANVVAATYALQSGEVHWL